MRYEWLIPAAASHWSRRMRNWRTARSTARRGRPQAAFPDATSFEPVVLAADVKAAVASTAGRLLRRAENLARGRRYRPAGLVHRRRGDRQAGAHHLRAPRSRWTAPSSRSTSSSIANRTAMRSGFPHGARSSSESAPAIRVRLDADIRNVSGATLSCRHVTEGVRRLCWCTERALRPRLSRIASGARSLARHAGRRGRREASTARALECGVKAAFAAVARVHRALSAHDFDDERVSRVNRGAARAWQPVSHADLRAVLACALDIASCSRGRSTPPSAARWRRLGTFVPKGRPGRRNCAPLGSAAKPHVGRAICRRRPTSESAASWRAMSTFVTIASASRARSRSIWWHRQRLRGRLRDRRAARRRRHPRACERRRRSSRVRRRARNRSRPHRRSARARSAALKRSPTARWRRAPTVDNA